MPFTHVRILSCRRGSRSFSEVGPSDASCPLRTSLSQTRQLYFSYQILFWKRECAVISACDTWAASAGDVHGVFLFIRKSSEESSVPFPLSGGRAVAQPPVASLGADGTARRWAEPGSPVASLASVCRSPCQPPDIVPCEAIHRGHCEYFFLS